MQPRNAQMRLVRDSVWTIASSAFLALCGIGLNLIIGNSYGENGLGIYTLATTIYLFASNLTAFGQPVALTKHTAEHSDAPEVGHQFYAAALIIVSVTGPAATIILLLIRPWLSRIFGIPEMNGFLVAVALAVPLFLINKVAAGRLNGLRQMRSMALVESLRYVFISLLTVGFLALAPGKLGAALWALMGAELLLMPFYWRLTRLLHSLSFARLKRRLRQLEVFGSQVLLSRIIAELNVRLDLLLAGFFLTPGEIGLYATALMFAQGIGILSVAIQKVSTPIMADLFAKNRIAELEHFVNRTMQVMTLVFVPLVVVMVQFFPQIIKVLYPGKPAFAGAYVPLVILSTGFLLRGIVVSVSSIYLSCGRPDVEYKFAAVFLLVNVIVALALVGTLRVNGIALGASAKAIAEFVLYTALMRRIVGVRVDYRPLLAMVSVAVLIITGVILLDNGVWSATFTIVLLSGFSLVGIRKLSLEGHLMQLCPALARFKGK